MRVHCKILAQKSSYCNQAGVFLFKDFIKINSGKCMVYIGIHSKCQYVLCVYDITFNTH